MRKPAAFAIVCLLAATAQAESLSVPTGLWEFTTTMPNMMTGQPTTRTEKKCISDSSYDPKKDAPGDMKGCTISDEKLSGTTLTWTMTCEDKGMKQTVLSTYTVDGESMTGSTDIKMTGPMNHEMKINHAGRRLGDCP
jgi:hypothetical protein